MFGYASSPLCRVRSCSLRPGNGARSVVPLRGERGRAVPMGDPGLPVEPAAAVLEGRHHLAQLRMHGAAVVALVVVLDDDLPVREDVVRDAPGRAEVLERIVPGPLRDAAELVDEGPGRGQVDENEAAPGMDGRRVERELLLPEAVALAQERRDPELAVEPVRPCVIRAPDGPPEPSVRGGWLRRRRRVLQDQPGPAVTADVVEGAEVAVPAADDQQPFAGDVDVEVVAGGSQRLRSAHEEPFAVEDRLGLSREPLGGAVGLPGKGSHRAWCGGHVLGGPFNLTNSHLPSKSHLCRYTATPGRKESTPNNHGSGAIDVSRRSPTAPADRTRRRCSYRACPAPSR